MKAFDIRNVCKIATTGEAEERSTQTDRVTHGYDPRATPLLCSDTTSVPGEFCRAQGFDEPLDWSANQTPNGFPALTNRIHSTNAPQVVLQ